METASYHGSKNVLSKAARLSLTLVFLFPIEELLDGDQHHPLLRLVYTQQLLCCVVVVIVGNLGPSCLLRRKGVISFGAFVNIISRLVLPCSFRNRS